MPSLGTSCGETVLLVRKSAGLTAFLSPLTRPLQGGLCVNGSFYAPVVDWFSASFARLSGVQLQIYSPGYAHNPQALIIADDKAY